MKLFALLVIVTLTVTASTALPLADGGRGDVMTALGKGLHVLQSRIRRGVIANVAQSIFSLFDMKYIEEGFNINVNNGIAKRN